MVQPLLRALCWCHCPKATTGQQTALPQSTGLGPMAWGTGGHGNPQQEHAGCSSGEQDPGRYLCPSPGQIVPHVRHQSTD